MTPYDPQRRQKDIPKEDLVQKGMFLHTKEEEEEEAETKRLRRIQPITLEVFSLKKQNILIHLSQG